VVVVVVVKLLTSPLLQVGKNPPGIDEMLTLCPDTCFDSCVYR